MQLGIFSTLNYHEKDDLTSQKESNILFLRIPLQPLLILSNSMVLTGVVFPTHSHRRSAEASERSIISQQIGSMQRHHHSGSWKGELSGPQWARRCKEASVSGVLKRYGQPGTRPENKRWQDSNLAQRRGEEGVTIITEVFGHSPVWHSHLLRFTSSSGLHKPLQALPLTLGCFKSRSNPALMTTTVQRLKQRLF